MTSYLGGGCSAAFLDFFLTTCTTLEPATGALAASDFSSSLLFRIFRSWNKKGFTYYCHHESISINIPTSISAAFRVISGNLHETPFWNGLSSVTVWSFRFILEITPVDTN